MKTIHENPVDGLGTLGAPIRPAAPPAPDPVKAFEHINDAAKVVKPTADTIKPAEQHHEDAWRGCDLSDAYTKDLLEGYLT